MGLSETGHRGPARGRCLKVLLDCVGAVCVRERPGAASLCAREVKPL